MTTLLKPPNSNRDKGIQTFVSVCVGAIKCLMLFDEILVSLLFTAEIAHTQWTHSSLFTQQLTSQIFLDIGLNYTFPGQSWDSMYSSHTRCSKGNLTCWILGQTFHSSHNISVNCFQSRRVIFISKVKETQTKKFPLIVAWAMWVSHFSCCDWSHGSAQSCVDLQTFICVEICNYLLTCLL